MRAPRVAVIGAGMAGLSAALDLARGGARTTVFERAACTGGKVRELRIDGTAIDAGPTVFTMRAVFEGLFADSGRKLEDYVSLTRAEVLARHAWSENERLDLYADRRRTIDAIGRFAGAREADRYARFAADAQRIFQTLERPFIQAQRPTPLTLMRRVGFDSLRGLVQMRPFASLWRALGGYFRDPRLRQLFARYATYCGSSPFHAPATLMLIAHVEQDGVWLVSAGMHRVTEAVAQLARECGAEIRLRSEVVAILTRDAQVSGVRLASGEFVPADAVVVNGDYAAIASGGFGPEIAHAVPGAQVRRRSLSALTWALRAEAQGFPLSRHTVFFSPDYAAEFEQIFARGELPAWPTVYVCAQDRDAAESATPAGAERLLCLVNAPPNGDTHPYSAQEIEQCERRTFTFLKRCGLEIHTRPEDTMITTPRDFARLFPGSGGALYGQATHGWRASFTRPGARTRLRGLYLAGGSVHPGPGLPMTALSGRLAAARLLADLPSTAPLRRAGMPGGTSTP